MKKSKPKSIQASIFRFTASIILLLTITSMMLYYFTMSRGFVRNYTISSAQLTKIISSRLDTQIKSIDLLQRRLLESQSFREFVFVSLPQQESKNIFLEQRDFEQTIYGFAGYDYPFRHLSVLTLDGYLVSFGEKYGFSVHPLTADDHRNIKPILDKNGALFLRSLEAGKIEPGLPGISLCRSFSLYPLNPPKAVIELQIETSTLEKLIADSVAAYDSLSNQVIVLNENSELIYPPDLGADAISYYSTIDTNSRQINPLTKQDEIITTYTSPYTHWTSFVVTPYRSVTLNTQRYLLLAVSIGLLALIVLLFITHKIAKSISSPIIVIKDSLNELNWENLGSSAPDISSGYNELELLTETFQLMERRLEESLVNFIELKSLSVQSQVRALQSQINPHFLYNTLSIMSILAETNGDPQVAEMGQKLVEMLRYSSKEGLHTTIGQEIKHAKNYAQLMEVRFGTKIQFDFLVDPLLFDIEVPPMVIQPLIENCIKYAGSGKNGKLIIATIGELSGDSWVIQISDNGKGFSPESLALFDNAAVSTESTERILEQEKTGIGLTNIYRRLYLYYGGKCIFKMSNSEYGAIVTIGGLLEGRSF